MKFDKDKYKVYTWKNWMVLHWILNPGLAVNQLIFGQRVPKISLEDKYSDKPRFERTLVPCPHCETLHDGRIWSFQNGTVYKNWFGLYCTNCGNIIPCLMNAFAFIILALTFPIWGWFRKQLKAKWLENQPILYESIEIENIQNPFSKMNWIKQGLGFSVLMFVPLSLVFPYFDGQAITAESLLYGFIVCAIGGFGFGYTMKLYMNKTV